MDNACFDLNIFTQILREELVPAMGCTEPIALAFAGAKAREILGTLPDKVIIEASGSIIKNVKSVVVPNTGNLKGIPAAVCAGIALGNADKKLEVLSDIKENEIPKISEFLEKTEIEVKHLKSGFNFDIILSAHKGGNYAKIRITNAHTNITLIEKDGEKLFETKIRCESDEGFTDRSVLSGEAIWKYITEVDIEDIKPILKRQIEYNKAIAEEGLKNDYGASIGKVILSAYGDNVRDRAKAMAAAGSDARMNGCELPVIINSGSGNQGMTCSLPVLEYAKELKSDDDKLYRALALSNLIAIHIKSGIGRLSAYCGAVSAGAAAGGGIAYLYTEDYKTVMHTVVNALGIVSGIICDGAKASCAAKIAASVDAGILGFDMYRQGKQFVSGDGIVAKGFEANVKNIGRLGKTGMKTTDAEILSMMMDT
ncbi:MAG: serine dehydratase subunit alpha family protein [Ruminococcaceae bacterium]|nr:serine dehydratase subunit alpha family protein [Oscillospiraceae bacterium]